jgi:hypothetical protein
MLKSANVNIFAVDIGRNLARLSQRIADLGANILQIGRSST